MRSCGRYMLLTFPYSSALTGDVAMLLVGMAKSTTGSKMCRMSGVGALSGSRPRLGMCLVEVSLGYFSMQS